MLTETTKLVANEIVGHLRMMCLQMIVVLANKMLTRLPWSTHLDVIASDIMATYYYCFESVLL